MTAPNADSVQLMARIDALTEEMRALVHDYGATIVLAMVDEGADDADALRDILEGRRLRKQEEWLVTDFIAPKGPLITQRPRPVFNTRAGGGKASFAAMLARYQDAEKLMQNWNAGR